MNQRRGHAHKSAARRGFTLIELSVALLLAALLVGVSIPAMRSVAATQLKRSAGQMAGLAREAYARSAVSGKPHRMVMDLDSGTFWLEEGSGTFALQFEKQKQLTEAELQERAQKKELSKFAIQPRESDLNESERLKAQLTRGPSWTAVEDDLGQPQKLPSDCAFEKVWVAHQAEAFVRGQSLLYFWPSGRTETAIIRLTDDPENNSRIISVKVNGLTGRTMVVDRALEIPTS